MRNSGKCAGEEFAAFAGIGFISSYLVLFISFYFATYKKDGKAPTARKAVRRMSRAPVPEPHTVAAAVSSGHEKATSVRINGVANRSQKA